MLIAPMPEALNDWISFDERLGHWLARPVTIEPDVVLCSYSVDEKTLVAVALGYAEVSEDLRRQVEALVGPSRACIPFRGRVQLARQTASSSRSPGTASGERMGRT